MVERRRRLAALLAAALFATQFAWLDLAFRGPRAWSADAFSAAGLAAQIETVLLWTIAVALGRARLGRVLVAGIAATLVVVQVSVFRYYHAPLDVQVAASALYAWADVRPVLARAAPALLALGAAAFVVEYGLLTAFHAALPGAWRRARPRALAIAACAGLLLLPPRTATPDVRGVHALVALRHRSRPAGSPGPRGPVSLPPLYADGPELLNVLLILTESVRAEDYVDATTPATKRALPAGARRFELSEMRAISSYTAVSFSALVGGLAQDGPREAIVRAPTLFDFARAARDPRGRRPTVAYISAQDEDIFEAPPLAASIDRLVTLETLLGHGPDVPDPRRERGVDGLLVDRFEEELRGASGPLVAVLHLRDTHAPYVVDPADAPFQPYDNEVAWTAMGSLRNAYKDAIVRQDRLVARAVRAFVARAGASPWLIAFTSDHGEAFGDHGAIHHGQNLFDEQVHVPGWIAAGPGTLPDDRARALAAHRDRFVTHLDVLPTLLDAMGLLDNFAVAPHRAAMAGRSLLQAWRPQAPIAVTNCTGMFPCPTNTWGLFEEDRKLLARIYDASWVCLAVGGGPERLVDGPDPACERLRTASRGPFPLLPNGAPNR